ncbi:Rv2231c family pyridoxal phosphate-dependent protein CobC [Pilimelia columellifera subsp. columellifera]|uniref:Aminotransferase n=2 Tax=Pilimelia TaxID=53370 RepID=A0ABP6B2I2_9ACTN
MADVDLAHHGDAEVGVGLVDLAVNVRREPPPQWLTGPIAAALGRLGHYPDQGPARAAVARRHARPTNEVLLTAGAAEGFVLLARGLGDLVRPVVVHPQFTEPEQALRNAGRRVHRVLLDPGDGFALHPERVPEDADLVVVGNPTNPTSTLHPAAAIAALARPGRVLVVDEAFADSAYRPGCLAEPESLASRRDLPGLVVVRSLTKTWGLAGLRIGYLLGPPDLLARLAAAQPLWPVSTPALAAARACASEQAVAAERAIARRLAADRDHLARRLAELPQVHVSGQPSSAFVLIRTPGARRIRLALRDRGFAVRRGDTFPGLGADWLRLAVRDTAITDAFIDALADSIDEGADRAG